METIIKESEKRYCNMSTRVFARPLLEAAQVGVLAVISDVDQTPNSVATITSFLFLGLNKAQRIGISGKLPDLSTQVFPPFKV